MTTSEDSSDDVVIVRDDDQHDSADDAQDSGAPAETGSGSTGEALAKPKRQRGPNKPKPGLFAKRTEASLDQTQIVEVLRARAAAEPSIGKDMASNMVLEIFDGSDWRPLDPASIRFTTR